MTRRVLPVVLFGRVVGSGGLPGSYQILSDLEGDSCRREIGRVVTEGIAPSFGWRPHPSVGTRHPPAFCRWNDEHLGVLVARILDVGADQLDRPHQVRIEAVQLTGIDETSQAELAVALLEGRGWPREAIEDQAREVEFDVKSRPSAVRRSAFDRDAIHAAVLAAQPRLLVAAPGSCTWSAGQLVERPVIGAESDDPSSWPARPAPLSSDEGSAAPHLGVGTPAATVVQSPHAVPEGHPGPRGGDSMSGMSRFAGWTVALLLAVALGVLVSRHLALRAEHTRRIAEAEEVSQSLNESLATQEAMNAQLSDQLAAAAAARDRSAAELVQVRRLAIEAEDALRASDPEGVRRENLLLRQLLRAQVDRLRTFVDDQAQLVDEQLGSAPSSSTSPLPSSGEDDERSAPGGGKAR